jgi:hypothetical protein
MNASKAVRRAGIETPFWDTSINIYSINSLVAIISTQRSKGAKEQRSKELLKLNL